MSWDINVTKHCPHCDRTHSIEVGNYTYNVTDMYNLAFTSTGHEYHGFNALDGKRCGDMIDCFGDALKHMRDIKNRKEYIALNPPNGWGNYEGAVEFLAAIHKACCEYPDYELYVG